MSSPQPGEPVDRDDRRRCRARSYRPAASARRRSCCRSITRSRGGGRDQLRDALDPARLVVLPAEDDGGLLRPGVDPVDRRRRLVEDERDALRADGSSPGYRAASWRRPSRGSSRRPPGRRGTAGRGRRASSPGAGRGSRSGRSPPSAASIWSQAADRSWYAFCGSPSTRSTGRARRLPKTWSRFVVDRPERRLAGRDRAQRLRPAAAAAEARTARSRGVTMTSDEGEDRHRRPALGLPLGGGRRHPSIGGPAMGQDVLGAVDEAGEQPAGGAPGAGGRGLDGGHATGHVVGERDRRAVGGAGQRLGRPDRDEGPRAVGRRRPRSPRTRSSRRCRCRRPRR